MVVAQPRWVRAGSVLGAALAVLLAGCTSTVSGRAEGVAAPRGALSTTADTPPTTSTSPDPGSAAPDPATAEVCTVLDREVPGTLDTVDVFIEAVNRSDSGLDRADPAVVDALAALGSTVTALDGAVAAAGGALSAELSRDTGRLARSLEQVGSGITAADADAFNDAIDAVGTSYAAAESHCRFV